MGRRSTLRLLHLRRAENGGIARDGRDLIGPRSVRVRLFIGHWQALRQALLDVLHL